MDAAIRRCPRESRLQQIRNAIAELRLPAECELSPALVAYLLRAQLGSSEHGGQLYSGGVTFCGMRPMRSMLNARVAPSIVSDSS